MSALRREHAVKVTTRRGGIMMASPVEEFRPASGLTAQQKLAKVWDEDRLSLLKGGLEKVHNRFQQPSRFLLWNSGLLVNAVGNLYLSHLLLCSLRREALADRSSVVSQDP